MCVGYKSTKALFINYEGLHKKMFTATDYSAVDFKMYTSKSKAEWTGYVFRTIVTFGLYKKKTCCNVNAWLIRLVDSENKLVL